MYTCYIQSFKILASVAEQAGLNVTRSKIPEDTFSRDVVHIVCNESSTATFMYAPNNLFKWFID